MLKNRKGITLIALIVSIIVLLILAGVTVLTLTGDNGLFQKAESSIQANDESRELELIELAVSSAQVEGKGTLTAENLNNELKANFNNNGEVTESSDYYTYKAIKKYRIYKDGKVEENNSLLPPEYQQVEYIESTGIQYIDTKIVTSTQIQTNFDFEYTDINSSYNRIFGAAYSIGSQYGVRGDRSYMGFFYGELPTGKNEVASTIMLEVGKRYKIRFNENKKLYIDDVEVNMETTDKVGWQNIYLFSHNGQNLPSKIKLYSCTMFENTEVIRDFVPCYSITTVIDVNGIERPKDTIGIYDTVEGKFYTNQGTGEFLKGADV